MADTDVRRFAAGGQDQLRRLPAFAPVIRLARRGDVEAIRMILAEGWVSQRAALGMPPQGAPWLVEGDDTARAAVRVAGIRAGIESAGESRWLVALVPDGLVGFTVAAVAPDGTRSIAALYASRRGIGVGSALLRRALAVHAGHDVRLQVVDGDERAARFYERRGFRFTGTAGGGMFTQALDCPVPLREMIRPATGRPSLAFDLPADHHRGESAHARPAGAHRHRGTVHRLRPGEPGGVRLGRRIAVRQV